MAESTTPGEARRVGLRRARWIAAGTSIGAAALLTGAIAAVDPAPAASSASNSGASTQVEKNNGIADDEFEPAEPFSPQTQMQLSVPQTSSHGS